MSIRISNIRLPIQAPESELELRISQQFQMDPAEILSWRILRKSLDARSRHDLRFVFSIVVELPEEAEQFLLRQDDNEIQQYHPKKFIDPQPGPVPLDERPIIVGTGPAGLIAGYYLAAKGFRPILIERGSAVKERVPAIRRFDSGQPFEPENNYLFGEGGAGTFSDGKLTCRLSGPDVDWVLDRFVDCGGKKSIAYEHRPHLGSNRLPLIIRNLRRRIEAFGGEYRFNCRLEGLNVSDGRILGVRTSSGDIPTSQLILAIGHSARDTYQWLYDLGVAMEPKAFQLGLRIEQPQEQIDKRKYADSDSIEVLGAADYSLVARGQRDLYTFCMCAGGNVIPSVSEPGQFCTNGMSNSRHDTQFANSGLVVTLEPHEFGNSHPLAGVALQRKYESIAYSIGRGSYLCPIQTADDFLAARETSNATAPLSSFQRGTTWSNLDQVLPGSILTALRQGLPIMNQSWKGEFLRNATLVGPEMRGSSPVRIVRDRDTLQATGIAGLYPAGEGAGYAGGIISAAVDGLRCAKRIVEQFAPLQRLN